jgi:hypothetical protein
MLTIFIFMQMRPWLNDMQSSQQQEHNPNIERISTMPDNYGNGGGYPSTTGNPSGGGRSNGPRK